MQTTFDFDLKKSIEEWGIKTAKHNCVFMFRVEWKILPSLQVFRILMILTLTYMESLQHKIAGTYLKIEKKKHFYIRIINIWKSNNKRSV